MHNSKCIFLKKNQAVFVRSEISMLKKQSFFCREDTRSAYLASGKWSQLVV